MADKNFGVKKLDIIGSGTPTIESPSGGDLNITAATSTFSGNVTLPDNKKLRLGDTAGDFDIYYDNDAFLTTGSRGLGIQVYNGTFSVSSGASNDFKFGLTLYGFTSAVDLVASGSRNIGTNTLKWNDAHFSGTVNATTFDGNLTGNVTGNVTGDVTGNADTATSATSATTATNATNATNATKAYVTETNTDTVTRGIVFCDAANNASGNKDLKYDRNLAYDPTGNRIVVDTFQGNTVNVGAITLGGSNGSSGQYVRSTGSGAEWADFPSGNIEPAIEVEQRSSNYTTSSSSYQTAITRAIDPVDSGSTLLIVAGGVMSGYRQDYYDDPEKSVPVIQLYRGSTPIGQEIIGGGLPDGNATGYYHIGFNLTFKDTTNHSGNSVTYYLKIKRNSNSDSQNVQIRKGTTLTVQEII